MPLIPFPSPKCSPSFQRLNGTCFPQSSLSSSHLRDATKPEQNPTAAQTVTTSSRAREVIFPGLTSSSARSIRKDRDNCLFEAPREGASAALGRAKRGGCVCDQAPHCSVINDSETGKRASAGWDSGRNPNRLPGLRDPSWGIPSVRTAWRGPRAAQSGERATSAQVMISRFVGSGPALGSVLTTRSLEPAVDSVSPSLSAPPPLMLCLSLSQI